MKVFQRNSSMVRTGRPREFDRDKAIDAATSLFWAQGYEPPPDPYQDLLGNISPSNLHAAFGSKEACSGKSYSDTW